jgi:hypothetical protein
MNTLRFLWGILFLTMAATAFPQAQPGGNTYVPGIGGSLTPTITTINATSTTAPYQYNGVTVGYYAVDPGGGYSMFFGQGAGATTTPSAIAAMTKGFFTCAGYNSCGGASTGMTTAISENTAYGWSAGSFWTSASFNTALGVGTMRNDPTAINCVAVGVDTMGQEGTTTGCSSSVGVGVGTLKWGTTGPATSTAVGDGGVLGGNTAGTSVFTGMTAVGYGSYASSSAGTMSFDTAIGTNTGLLQTSGNYNLYAGSGAGSAETVGAHNVILAPNNNASICSTGNGNFIAGYEMDCYAAATANEVNIGSSGVSAIRGTVNARASGNLSSCGGTPSISANATDMAGTITTGSAATACTLTLGIATGTAPTCLVTARSGTAPAYSTTDNGTTATLALTTAAAAAVYDYWCPVH